MLILLVLYFLHDRGLTLWFRSKFNKNDFFMGKEAPDEVQGFFGKAMYLVMLYYLILIIHLLTGFSFWGFVSNIVVLDNTPIMIIGFALSLGFLCLMTLSRMNLGSSWRVGLDQKTTDSLITDGFYKFVRNPYFAALLGFQFSLILVVPNAITVFSFIQSSIMLNLQVRQEEIFLNQKYGNDYQLYKNKTGRFLPRVF